MRADLYRCSEFYIIYIMRNAGPLLIVLGVAAALFPQAPLFTAENLGRSR